MGPQRLVGDWTSRPHADGYMGGMGRVVDRSYSESHVVDRLICWVSCGSHR